FLKEDSVSLRTYRFTELETIIKILVPHVQIRKLESSITHDALQTADNDNLNAVQLMVMEAQHGWITARGMLCQIIFEGRQSIRHKSPITIPPKDDSLPFLLSSVIFKLAEGEMVFTETSVLMFSDFYSSDDYILSKITEPTSAREVIKEFSADGPCRVLQSVEHHHFGEEIFQDFVEFISDSQEPPNPLRHIWQESSVYEVFSTSVSNFRWIMNIALHYNYVKRYQHDDSETLEDIVIFSATDGFNTADGVLRVQSIAIVCHDDYGLIRIVNKNIRIQYLNFKPHEILWLNALELVDEGLMLLYTHDDTESLEDSFTVQLTDGKRTVQGTLYIYIMPVNDEIPRLSSLSEASFTSQISFIHSQSVEKIEPFCDIVLLAKPVTLTEGDRVTLTTDVPVATDGTSKPEKLLYAVSLPPVHGQIEHINYPGVPISSYRQLDVVAQKVSDVHDNSHGAGKESLSGHKRHTTELAGFFNLLNGGSGGGVVGDFIFQMVRFPEDMANSIEESLL
ncbi:LOW QUALITY PROTEIN: FRAS1-related extracellular matrix protein 1-like, partial [Pluvialis apricaria]